MKFCLDTSSLIEAWARSYPPDVFHTIWQELEKRASSGVIVTSSEVLRELERQDDGLAAWAKARPGFVVELTEDIQKGVREILDAHPGLVNPGSTRNQADPFVIATARALGRTVVSQENRSNKPAKPKIPDVCDALAIEHINLLALIRRLGIKT